ncbi:MAG: hypothetical protein DRO88_09310 [Promethearchaeia archaeon]|nr:MAG: hypothetical protein DRO88_09310 [Candidatus Lokiarchaeia archaeon]
MNQEERITFLVDLFHAIDIREKGIEYVYDILLQKQSVADIKEFVEISGISLKRTYKVIQLLEKLGLIQVYNRPMIVNIKNPITSWEILISEKIKEIRLEADHRIENCEISFQNFLRTYNLNPDNISVPPVEFISISATHYTPKFFNSDIVGESEVIKFVKGDIIKTPFNEKLKNILKKISEDKEGTVVMLKDYCKKWQSAIPNINIEVLLTEDYVHSINDMMKDINFRKLEDETKADINLPSINIRVSSKVITNFLLRDNRELIQYSTSPDNSLIGLFISRQSEIYDIFAEKYKHEFNHAVNLDQYYIKNFNRPVTLFEMFFLTLM